MAVLAIVANVVDRLGLLGRVEKFLQDAGFAKGFKVDLSIVLRAAAGVGFGLVIVAVIATMLLGFFFNGVSGLLGGLVITVLEERPPTPRPDLAPALVAAEAEPAWDEAPTMWDAPVPAAQWDSPTPAAQWDAPVPAAQWDLANSLSQRDAPNQSGPVAGTAV
jgi:hypothetical protein